jgi:glycosyltransferase involved in cell wall biosynthesis
VDGGSTDKTVQIIQAEAAGLACKVVVIVEPGCNISRGRNIAIRNTTSEFIAVTDAGCELKPEWLEELVAPFEHDETVEAVIGWSELHPDSAEWTKQHAWLFMQSLDKADPKELLPSSRSCAFLKSRALRLGGYPEHLTRWAEDTLFCLNLTGTGTRWAFAPEAVVYWHGPRSWRQFLRLRRNYCLGNGEARIFQASGGLAAREVLTLGLLLGLTGGSFMGAPFLSSLMWVGLGCLSLSLLYLWKSSPARWVRYLRLSQNVHRGFIRTLLESWLTRAGDTVGTLQGLWRSRGAVLRRVLDLDAQTIVFPPSHEWSWMKQRPAHIAEAFARRGLQVVYCPNNKTEQIYGGLLKVADRIVLCNETAYLRHLTKPPIIYSVAACHFTKRRVPISKKARMVFDLVDEVGATNSTEEDVRVAVREAELTIAATPRLAEYVHKVTGRSASILANAVSYEDWRPRGRRTPPDLAEICDLGSVIIGYTGAIGYWFDFELVRTAAIARPAWQFVLIGPVWNDEIYDRIATLPANVHLLGLKHYSELPAYVEHFTVAMIPFLLLEETVSAGPLKLYEYAAMEVPIVTTDLPECRSCEVARIASTTGEFVQCVEEAAAERADPAAKRRLGAFGQTNSWDERVDAVLSHLGLADRYPRSAAARDNPGSEEI